jgi:PTS system nitrogen regulatory IIA component
MDQLLATSAICLDCASQSKKRALEHAAHLLGGPDTAETDHIFDRLLARERLGSTGLADGVALPHARLPDLAHSRGSLIRLRQAIDFDSQDGQPVDLMFVLLVPEDARQGHLQLLSRLAALFRDASVCRQLRHLSDVYQVQQLFARVVSDAT